jgi:hypothetical protein
MDVKKKPPSIRGEKVAKPPLKGRKTSIKLRKKVAKPPLN